jgi:SAM-dependent methyltransferase
MAPKQRPVPPASRSWDPVAGWYSGWVGAQGSEHHRRLAIPALLGLLEPVAGERILDVGCGTGALAPHVTKSGARYTGIDASRKLLAFARQHHGARGDFVLGDATRLADCSALRAGSFDAATFLLSIQDIDPLESAIQSAVWALRHGGRIVILMTHPCFRVPRQSGWGWDAHRKLQYRRIDRYLTPLAVPMKPYGGGLRGATRSYHRPLTDYITALATAGLLVDRLLELPTYRDASRARGGTIAHSAECEIPLFLGVRGVCHRRPCQAR